MVMSGDQNAGRSHNIKTDNGFFERVEHFGYLGTNVSNQNSIRKEISADWSHGISAISRCRTFCLPICYPKIWRL